MTFWNTIRSLLSTELMQLAIKVAPPEEKMSANLAVFGHLIRIINSRCGASSPGTPGSRPKPPPPGRHSKLIIPKKQPPADYWTKPF